MLYSNELIMLKDSKGDITQINPTIQFKALPSGDFIVLNSAFIKDVDSDEIVQILNPGDKITGSSAIDYTTLTKQELREILISEGKSFAKKATAADLIKAITND